MPAASWTSRAAQLAHETLHRLIATCKTVVRHQVLPDRHGIPATTESQLYLLTIGFARAGRCLGRLGGSGFREKTAQKSVVTSMAGFAGARRPHPGRHTTTPVAFRYALAVSLRTPVASSMRRKDHPSFPSAITCCFFSSLKTLLMPREPISAPLGVNVPGFCYGRFSGDLTWPDLGDR